jgi:hypothetical protein
MFNSRVLRETFEAKRDEVRGEWRRLHKEEFYDLYSSPNIIWLFKSRRMRWAEHSARMGAGEVHRGSWWRNPRERDRLEYLGVDWGIILKWILRKWDWGGVDWIFLAEDRYRWRTVLNAVMNLRVP